MRCVLLVTIAASVAACAEPMTDSPNPDAQLTTSNDDPFVSSIPTATSWCIQACYYPLECVPHYSILVHESDEGIVFTWDSDSEDPCSVEILQLIDGQRSERLCINCVNGFIDDTRRDNVFTAYRVRNIDLESDLFRPRRECMCFETSYKSEDEHFEIVPSDNRAPTPPSPFQAIVLDNFFSLTWSEPEAEDFAGVMIRTSAQGPRALPSEGDLLCDPCSQGMTVPVPQAGETVFLSAFAYDEVPNYSTPAQLEVSG